MKLNGKEIKLYYPNGETFTSVEEFLDYYNKQYYSINNKEVEEKIKEILENGIQSKEDLFRVFAWVLIKIDMKKSKGNAFVYTSGTSEEFMQLQMHQIKKIYIYQKDIEYLYKIYKEIEKHIGNCNTDEKAQEFLIKFRDLTKEKSWGEYFYSVYMITLLYFVSKGKYPIVNSSSCVALEAIYNNSPFGSIIKYPRLAERHEPEFEEIITKGTYADYIKRFKSFSELTKETDLREVDQALWMYGKLFKN